MSVSKSAQRHLPPGTKSSGDKGLNWESFNLLPSVLNVVQNVLGFSSLTPVQSATIPNFLEHKDVAVEVRYTISPILPIPPNLDLGIRNASPGTDAQLVSVPCLIVAI